MIKAGNKKKEMVGGYSRTRTYYFRRCKNSVMDCVPDEVLYEILARLPAPDISSAMLVCQKWYQIVCSNSKNFIHKHLEHSSYGLLIHNNSHNKLVFIYGRKVGGGIDKIEFNYSPEPRYTIPRTSSNGLVLESYPTGVENTTYFVRNVLSHKVFCLPQGPYIPNNFERCVIGYDAASMKYKVVLPFRVLEPYTCGIFTVGVDKSWRILSTDNISDIGKTVLRSKFAVTEGFIHWKKRSVVNKVLTLNLETEIFVETTPPISVYGRWLFSTGRYLTLFNHCKRFVWEVFEMKPETREWRKLPNICLDLEGLEGKIKRLGLEDKMKRLQVDLKCDVLRPCGWVKYPEVLALFIRNVQIIFYDLNTCEIYDETFPIPWLYGIAHHKNSLVRVDEL